MYRSPRDRKEHKVISGYHTSKNWDHPEQISPRFREPLEEIDQGYIRYTPNICHVYVSPMLEEANENWFDERHNGKPNEHQIYTKLERQDRYTDDYRFEMSYQRYLDFKHGLLIDYKQQAKDFMDERKIHVSTIMECIVEKLSNELCDEINHGFINDLIEDFAWQEHEEKCNAFNASSMLYARDVFDKIVDMHKIDHCPEDGRFVENELTNKPNLFQINKTYEYCVKVDA